MALAFDAAVDGGSVAPDTTITWNHTCTGSDGLLLVALSVGQLLTNIITGVTYNSVAMSRLVTSTADANIGYVEIWGLLAPTTGSALAVVATASASSFMGGGSVSYTGVKQSGLPDSTNSQVKSSGSYADITTSTTTVAPVTWIFSATYTNNAPAPTASTNQTQRTTVVNRGMLLGDTNANQSPGSNSMKSDTSPNAGQILQALVSFGEPSSGTSLRNLLGVGK